MVAIKRHSWTKKVAVTLMVFGFSILASGSATGDSSEGEKTKFFGKKNTIRISIGTQDQVINTAVGGATVREMDLLKKYLPTTGKYEGVNYDIQWSSYTSGPPITNKMLANQIDIGLMGDFPAAINLIKFREEGGDVTSTFIGTLAYSPNGAGNAVVVPKDSDVTSLSELAGKSVSVPFGSAAGCLGALESEQTTN